MKDPSTHAKLKGRCSTMEFILKVDEKNKITDAPFFTDGCGTTVACGSMMIKLIEKKSLEEVQRITKEDLKGALGGIPPDNEHCATLAVKTLKETIANYKKNKTLH
jgi:nitrogen fixation NifU-like protein